MIRIGMAELAAIKATGQLSTLGLGSCVAVCLYDSAAGVGGMAHVMLPVSSLAVNAGNPGKFADTALPLLLSEMIGLGAQRQSIKAILVGGAEMFSFPGKSLPQLRIGERNIAAVREWLQKNNFPVLAESVGGIQGKSVVFDVGAGLVKVKTLMGNNDELRFSPSLPA